MVAFCTGGLLSAWSFVRTPVQRCSRRKKHTENANQSASFVVMYIHEHPCQSVRVSWIVLLALSYVDKTLGEPVAVVGVVSAAAPHPVVDAATSPITHSGGDGGRSWTATAAARRQLGVAAASTDGVDDSRRRHSVNQRCLTASCTLDHVTGMKLNPFQGCHSLSYSIYLFTHLFHLFYFILFTLVTSFRYLYLCEEWIKRTKHLNLIILILRQ